jgi:chromosome segregation ATPase
MADSLEVLQERTRSLEDSVRDLKDSIRHLESRARELETNGIEALRQQIWRLEGKTDSFESAHDENKEKWNMALNFLVQIMWVVTASFVLAKLGLGTGAL